ncbi:TonB-dependent receptor [Pedobacter duraquae]|uniref:Outer membrane receptor protein involved in Fe transport n=1 Tax=Pedobacter duraquae TaxID=425511 RepID=A0A4R6IQ81_9SPHI|nr:TonB-dependent receptor [Pedobacter duraquae]TDO24479.1 outer membrane receptor protein involved in Fe transport [Pedobacter duraquae]
MNKKLLVLLLGASGCFTMSVRAQDKKNTADTVKVKPAKSSNKEEQNRNVMLNAANNTGPREVNIGLPSSVGGITILENNMPVVHFFWPELPTSSWRQSVSLGQTGLLKLGEVAITQGALGFAVNSYSRAGSDKTEVFGTLSSNQFGWLKGDLSVSGKISDGWYYTAGVYENFDPSTYDLGFAKYVDKTQIYRAGISKHFKKGEVNLLYKHTKSASLTNYSIFNYQEGGNAEELANFRIGRDSYFINSGMLRFKDVLTGDYKNVSLADDAYTTTNTIDITGNYQVSDRWKLNFNARYHGAKATQLYTIPLATLSQAANDQFTYANGSKYTGDVQSVLGMHSPNVPTQTAMARVDLVNKTARHNWRVGLTESYYNVDKFTSNRTFYYQEVGPNPAQLFRNTPGGGASNTDAAGFYYYNVGSEYHDGYENKLAAFFSDDWTVSDRLSVTYGLNLRYHKINGNYSTQDRTDGVVLGNYPTTPLNHDWFHTSLDVNAVYKITPKFGLIAELLYTEKNGQLESYSGAVVPNLAKTKMPYGSFGLYLNGDKFSLVSSVNYLTQNNNLTRLNLVNPANSSQATSTTVYYGIKTIGWTTDVVTTPFKNFSLHYLITLQNPIYQNYTFGAFGNNYDYNGKNVLGISKTLMEIDPSYTMNKFRFWASLRYYSKQFANLTNVLYFKSRWETFAGTTYKINKNFDFGVTVVNPLNQRGASGTISGAELITDPSSYYNTILNGSYIRPFTVEGTLNFHF